MIMLEGHGTPSLTPAKPNLPADILLGELQRLSRKLFSLMTLVAVTQVLSKLFRSQTKLLGQAI